ncbi:MAG: L,D-transpeptidase [Rhodobacteraceae bacterium]|nr:L,D-transpeptidase [Paracoccaceae bacterium]MCF8512857.1 L,D-transpeptidase [Paracoccaceae bacterium]MCF8517102.1 L,D-transpeptidase [Paracoccaceae bacterium]
MPIDRRSFLTTATATLLSGAIAAPAIAQTKPNRKTYVVPPEHQPITLRLRDKFEEGQILVDPNTFSLYWTLPKRQALRFVVGVGKGDLYTPGTFHIGAKKEWPSWTPTKEMIARSPGHYAQYANGMPGGPSNPLGARALYLFTEERGDTFLRIHGTPDPWTIGSAVSNGCVRLVNVQIEQLYALVPMGTKVVLYPKRSQKA